MSYSRGDPRYNSVFRERLGGAIEATCHLEYAFEATRYHKAIKIDIVNSMTHTFSIIDLLYWIVSWIFQRVYKRKTSIRWAIIEYADNPSYNGRRKNRSCSNQTFYWSLHGAFWTGFEPFLYDRDGHVTLILGRIGLRDSIYGETLYDWIN